MTFAEALAHDVPERTRVKGNRYFLGGAVRSLEASNSQLNATVRGSRLYRIQLTRSHDEVLASCECPYFVDRYEICKHIWAVVLAADAEGLLTADLPPNGQLYLEPLFPVAFDPADLAEGGATVPGSQPRGAWVRPEAPPPPQPWERFLDGVRQSTRASSMPFRRVVDGEILYVIDSDESLGHLLPILQVYWRTRKKSGEWGRSQPAAISLSELDGLAEADREILSLLMGATDPYGFAAYGTAPARASFRLAGPLVERVLPLLAQSGRLYLRRTGDPAQTRATSAPRGYQAGPSRLPAQASPVPPGAGAREPQPLTWDDGPPWRFRVDVELTAADRVRVDGVFEREGDYLTAREADALLTSNALAVHGSLARFDARGALPWLIELRRSGPIEMPRAAAPALVESMARSGFDPSVLPEPLKYELVDVSPKPRIRLARASRQPGYGVRDELEAHVEFDYGGTVLPAGQEGAGYDANRRRMVRRRGPAEREAVQRLHQLGFRRPWQNATRDDVLAIAVERFPPAVRTLVNEGWHVEAEGRAFRAASGMSLRIASGVDWFELHGQVDFGEGRSAPVAELLAALKRGEATVILDDGTRGMIPEEWLRKYVRIAGFGEASGDHVRFRPAQAALLDALLEAQPSVSVDDAFARARAQLATFHRIEPLDPPPSFRGRLRDYQREALGWFSFLRRFGFGGCLADDMGLGKTVMVLALLESRRRAREHGAPRTSIVVVPRSLVFNWMHEAAAFAPRLRLLDFTGDARASAALDGHDLVVTTYGTLRRDAARLAAHEFDYVILDEAQAIKNPGTASAKAARVLRASHRLALSGTPIENHLGELWSLFEFLNPGFLGPAAAFGRAMAPQARAGRADLAPIARALRPFILRRTKEQVAPELPDKVEQTIHCDLEPAERRFYDSLRAHYRQTLLARIARTGLNRSKMQVLEALLRLRQAALHPGLVDPRRAEDSSSKLELLLARLGEIIDEGHKALVFSQFTTLLGLLRPRLESGRIVYEYLDGSTTDRAERVARFESDPRCSVFLISLKAGGVGLNLTAADYVFLLDPWWNPAVEAQAIDRTHRIGQSKHVFAYRLIARDTVEEKIAELQQSKRELADAILGADENLVRSLRAEDLDWLLS